MAESDLEMVTMAANMNADTVREQQQEIHRLKAENAELLWAIESAQSVIREGMEWLVGLAKLATRAQNTLDRDWRLR